MRIVCLLCCVVFSLPGQLRLLSLLSSHPVRISSLMAYQRSRWSLPRKSVDIQNRELPRSLNGIRPSGRC